MYRRQLLPLFLAAAVLVPAEQARAQLLDFEKPWSANSDVSLMYGDGLKRSPSANDAPILVKLTEGIGVFSALLACQQNSLLNTNSDDLLGALP